MLYPKVGSCRIETSRDAFDCKKGFRAKEKWDLHVYITRMEEDFSVTMVGTSASGDCSFVREGEREMIQ